MRPEPPAAAPAAPSRQRRVFVSPIGSRRVEASLAVATSAFGALFSLQSVPVLLAQQATWWSTLGTVVVVAVYGSIGLAGLAALLRQWTRPIFLLAAVVYPIALGTWPLVAAGPLKPGEVPWLVMLSTVPTGFLMVAQRGWKLPAAYCLALSGMIVLLRSEPAGGGAPDRALLDGVYALALNTGLLVLMTGVRLAARSVDVAQQTALQRYADAQIDQATEYERVQIDALVHDSVLTTFLTAAKAASPEESALAARMARNAIAQLAAGQREAGQEQTHVALPQIAARIRAGAGAAASAFALRAAPGEAAIPAAAADGVVAAAVQAMVNSVNHAGDDTVRRTIELRAVDGGVAAIIADRGVGFDPGAVAPERLGVRVSIVERMQAAGGRAEVRSVPGRGTVVTLVWPADAGLAEREPEPEAEAVGAA